MVKQIVFVAVSLFCSIGVDAQIKLDGTGRTIAMPTAFGGPITIQIQSKGKYQVRYRPYATLPDEAVHLNDDDPVAPEDGRQNSFTIPPDDATPFVVYNLFRDATTILKKGIIARGPHRKQVIFSFPRESFRLNILGEAPVLTDADFLYVTLTNRTSKYQASFTLSVAVAKGTPIEEASVRPGGSGERAFVTNTTETEIFDDVTLSVGKLFAGNDIPKLTITKSPLPVTQDETKSGESQDVNLLTNYVLPQVHPLYRFNVTTGAMFSGVRDREFAKVQTQLDNPMTTENETRYRIAMTEAGRTIRPALGITLYWHPIDPLLPLRSRDRLIPQPTIAFGFQQPADNAFIGFTNEIARSVQLMWGVHRGKTSELQPRSDVAEDQQSTLPPTRSRPQTKAFIGIAFNIKALGKIFGVGGT